MNKISGQYFTIWYYFGEYRVGVTKLYQYVIWADDEESATAQFKLEHWGAHIKRISS